MSDNELQQIVRKCLKNEAKAQEQLYRFTYESLFNVALRYCRDKEEAQWVFNMAMLQVFKSLNRFDIGSNYLGWSNTIIVRSSINYIRQNLNHQRLIVHVEDNDWTRHDFELNTALDRMEEKVILELIQELPDRERLVFSMHEIDGFSHPEIEEQTGIKKNTSKWLLANAKKRLQAKVSTIYHLKPCANE